MRVEKLAELMKKKGFDGALISPGSNFYYLTSIRIHEAGERPTLLAVNPEGDFQILAPSLYENVIHDAPVTFWRDGENPYAKLATIAHELGISGGNLLIENTMRADWLIELSRTIRMNPYPLSLV
ncbi:aminopeptidase P family N-terminal domain-containing protein, partial [Thermococcus sp.]